MKYITKLQKLMYGRYGLDELYKFLFFLYIILFFINMIIKSNVISYITLIIVIIMFYRTLSKNQKNRRKENEVYLKIINSIKKPFKNYKNRINDKDHIYKKCHHCHTILKLPIPFARGIKHVICPECKKRNTFYIIKKIKIEVIKKEQ